MKKGSKLYGILIRKCRSCHGEYFITSYADNLKNMEIDRL